MQTKKPNPARKPKKTLAALLAAAFITAAMAISASAESGYVNTLNTGLNVRSGAGLTYSVITSLPKGTGFEILSVSGDWTKITAGSVTGYVHSSYVGRYAQAYPAVNLPAPYYTQYDSRWGAMTLGAHGGTIRNIGCTVTSLAMSESYRTGTAVTPASAARANSFTAGGALYWPSNYIIYNGSNWLAYAYSQLAAGRPVILHGQTWSGGSHWILIYGYTGGSSLSAENFLIRDPASTARVTLAQYLAVFPVYVKLVHYN